MRKIGGFASRSASKINWEGTKANFGKTNETGVECDDWSCTNNLGSLLSHAAFLIFRIEATYCSVHSAVGFNPYADTDVWDRSREAVGGDDFAEAIALSELDDVLKGRNEGQLFIIVYPSYFAIGWQKNR